MQEGAPSDQRPGSPGWYPDPVVPAQSRFWDGTAWSHHVAPTTSLAGSTHTNGFAIAAIVCALVPVFCGVQHVLAIIFGFKARGQIARSDGRERGAGLALAGIILGVALLVVQIVVLVVVVWFYATSPGPPNR